MAASVILVYAIVEAPGHGWGSSATLGTITGGAAVAVAFVLWELRHPSPILDLRFFRDPRFSAAVVGASALWFALSGWLFLMTQHLQFVRGYDAFNAGLRALPFAITVFLVTTQAAKLTARYGTKRIGTIGLLLVALAMFTWTRWSVATPYLVLAVTYVLLAAGQGMAIAPLTDSVMGSVPRERAGVASATNNTIRQLGQAVGIAVMGSALSSTYSARMKVVADGLPAAAGKAVRSSLGSALRVASTLGPDGAPVTRAARSAFVVGSHGASWIAVFVALAGAGLVARFLPARAGSE